MSLGSIYAPESGGARGRDLRWQVQVPARAVGGQGLPIELPDRLPVKDAPERAARTIHPGDPKGAIVLHLPAQFPSGSALRLRGYGEAKEGGSSGDLFLVVTLSQASSTALVRQVTALAQRESASWLWVALGAVLTVLGSFFLF